MHAASFGPTPSLAQFQQLLLACGAKHIVVGHTQVGKITPMFDGGLIPIDIPWTDPANVRALVIRGDEVPVVDIAGASSPLK